jgi:hypothetical protein
MPADTLLIITGMGIPPYSARGLTQSWGLISAANNARRTVNGKLINLSPAQFQKYRCSITCTDVNPPAINGIMPGLEVTVDWVVEFSYPTATGAPTREVVEGSSSTEGDWTFYRPRMVMQVRDFSGSVAEWDALTPWQLDLEEI